MRAKKARKSARSIRYLLYADQKLRKISLRRISARLKRARRSSKPGRSKNAMRAQIAVPSRWAAIAAGVTMCMVAVAAVLASREPAPRPRATARNIALEADTSVSTRTTRPPIETKRPEPPVEPAAASPAPNAASAVTIIGCLERGAGNYLLKNVTGGSVSSSRSWTSGFLKKRAPQFELVDTTNTLKLPAHVGKRVAATGVLVDRELQARSLRPVSGSCS